ncbi:MAG: replication protein P [Pseudomonadota bacterium]
MKSIDTLLPKASNPKAMTTAKPAASAAAGRDHIDAINQLFAEFELAYHNQFHKAFAAEGSLALAKKYWLSSLADFPPEVIRRAVRHVVQSQQYLPTLAAMIAACEDGASLFGLPTAEAAYREACLAPEPKAEQQWSHPAVYYAAQATGWFALANEIQSAVLPQFEYHYTQLCRRVLRGEALELPTLKALPATVAAPLSVEDNRKRLQALRAKLDL